MQPVSIEDLPERELVTAQNIGFTVRRLVALGLVRRYRRPEHPKRFVLTLDDRHPFAPAIRSLARSIARRNGLRWTPSPSPSDTFAAQEGPNVTDLQILGEDRHPTRTLFGSANRTQAVLFVACMGEVDRTTIGTVCGIDLHADAIRLFDPIEADGLFRSRMVGSIRLYSLGPGPWVKPLRELAAMVVAQDKLLGGRMNAAKILMVTGGYSNRKHLRARLGLE